MKPTLLTIGQIPISSFGLFLLLSLLAAAFVIFRVARIYDYDEEKVIDLVLYTFVGGLVGARVYFILSHLDQFDNLLKMVLINRYPGLSFWGGLIGGVLTVRILTKYFKVNFWQAGDFAALGLFIGLSIGSFGCLLGSCMPGKLSTLPIAVAQVGLVGNRFPLQVVEGIIFLSLFWWLLRQMVKFHPYGKIAAQALLLLGLVKFILELFRPDTQRLMGDLSAGTVWSSLLIVYGVAIYYRQTKRNWFSDWLFLTKLLVSAQIRQQAWTKILKNWYNFRVDFKISLRSWSKSVGKLLHVRSNPTKFQ